MWIWLLYPRTCNHSDLPDTFTELHIEQGPILDRENIAIGAVEDLQGIAWYDFVPFTAMMVTPVRLLMGVIPVWAGAACLGITVILAILVTYLAGKVYSLMSLYKGSVPKPGEMLKIIFGKA